MSTESTRIEGRKYRALTRKDIDRIKQLLHLGPAEVHAMKAVSAVFPFRVNQYVIDDLIDWDAVPDDPIFQLTFPQPGMLDPEDLARMLALTENGGDNGAIAEAAREIQLRLNPHPAGQLELNVPHQGGRALAGIQHKYRETVLFFPSQGQTCHAYCTYCFRWAQFVGIDELKFASREAAMIERYLRHHDEVHDILFTGGDPLIMRAGLLRRYIEPLLEIEHLTSIRIGTKAPAYWPFRFLTDPDADDLMRLFEEVTARGKHLALMAHYSHPRELQTAAGQAALRRICSTGAIVRCQAPLVRYVNDNAAAWTAMWRLQVHLGAVPYYMFVERDTGPKNYFEVPLARSLEIFQKAYRRVSGLGRTVRGPSMSATPGKVCVEGITEVHGEKLFVLRFIQARDPSWVGRPFFAKFDPNATWLSDLEPGLDQDEFFFKRALEKIQKMGRALAWGEMKPSRRAPLIFGHVEWE